jgi:hypothetical protein
MARSPLRRISALTTFFGFLALATSGAVMLLTPGGGGQRGFGRTVGFLGISRHDWQEFHEIAGIVFLIAALVHLAFNWRALMRHLGLGGPARLSSDGKSR